MRPIDADALYANIGHRHMFSGESVGGFINNSPTIDAIPVEWLRGLMIEYANINTREHAAYAYCLSNVIEEWRKEQEEK